MKPGVRSQAAYTLRALPARRKLNQNECPYDFPPELKQAVLERAAAAPWHRYPEFVPARLVERLAAHYGWIPDGVLVGNGSNELIQATLSVVARRPATRSWRLRRRSRSTAADRRPRRPLRTGAPEPAVRVRRGPDRGHRRGRGAGTGDRAQLAQQPDRLGAGRRARWSASSPRPARSSCATRRTRTSAGRRAIPLLRRTLAAGGAADVLQGDGHGRAAVRPRAGAPGGGGARWPRGSFPTT